MHVRQLILGVLMAVAAVRPLDAANRQPLGTARSAVTFSKDIAPLLFEHCANCHRPGGSAPFSLLTFRDTKPRAREIVRAVTAGAMPPWKPEPGFGDFVGSRRLSADVIGTFSQWVEQGSGEGDPRDLPPPPKATDGWQLGPPDLILHLDHPYALAPDGIDRIRTFVIPVPISNRRYVRAWELRTSAPQVVHHATMVLDPTRASRERDQRDPEGGYEGLIPLSAQNPEGFFMGWTPGQTASMVPAAMAWHLDPGTDMLAMLHLRPNGTSSAVDVSIGLYFSDSPPTQVPAMIRLNRQDIDIPAGQPKYVVKDSYTLPVDVYVHSVQPHAHSLAREIKGVATMPDGSQKWLLYIRNWDFYWQDTYRYVEPFLLPAGSRLEMTFTYDNSAANRANPSSPPRRVLFGQRTTDEMADLWLQVVPRRPEDLPVLQTSLRRKLLPQTIDGYRTMLRGDPANVGLHDDLAMLHLQTGDVRSAESEFAESARLAPDSPATQYNVGNAQLLLGRFSEAESRFRQALGRVADYGLARQGLGLALQAQGRLDEAAVELSLALKTLPSAEAHYNLASLRHRQERLADALAEYDEALRIQPDYADAHFGRGLVLAYQGHHGEAVQSFRRALAIRAAWPAVQLELAWTLATTVDDALRNPAEALALTRQLAADQVGSRARLMDLLAAAQAATGRFKEAVETARFAITDLTAEERLSLEPLITHRLEEYRDGHPYRSRAVWPH
jgi:tetratricopeptide (TPR) repeat protein/mono/diheme cytochrome c family protein